MQGRHRRGQGAVERAAAGLGVRRAGGREGRRAHGRRLVVAGVADVRAALDAAGLRASQVFRAPLVGETGADPKTYGKTLFETDDVRAWSTIARRDDVLIVVVQEPRCTRSAPAVIDGLTQGHRARREGRTRAW